MLDNSNDDRNNGCKGQSGHDPFGKAIEELVATKEQHCPDQDDEDQRPLSNTESKGVWKGAGDNGSTENSNPCCIDQGGEDI